MLNEIQRQYLRTSCLVLTDDDFREANTLDDICTDNVRYTVEDITHSLVVIYEGALGQKVLKLRPAKITRKQLVELE